MAILTPGPSEVEQAIHDAAEGDTVVVPFGAVIPTKRVTLQVAPAPAPEPFTFTVAVNGRQVASEAVSRGDVVEVRVS